MSKMTPNPEPACWDCGATNDPGASECWLCQRTDWKKYPGLRRGRPAPELPRRRPMSTIAGWMILIAAIGVAVGLFREAPGLAVSLLVSIAPALAITEVKAYRRQHRGVPMTIPERIAMVLILAIVIPILVIIALVVALFTYCFLISPR
jgi:hypothetical protein